MLCPDRKCDSPVGALVYALPCTADRTVKPPAESHSYEPVVSDMNGRDWRTDRAALV